MKRKLFTIILTLSFGLAFFLPSIFAQDYTQWHLPEGAKARLGKGGINDITCTQDGTLLAVASQIGIWIYDVQTGEELALLTEHTGMVNRVAFSPNGHTLASGGLDNTVRLWNVDTWTEIGILEGYTGEPDSILFSPDGRTLVSRGDDNILRLWDVRTQTQIHTLEGHIGSIESVSFSSDGQILASGGKDKIVRLWDIGMRTEIGTLEGHTGYVSSVSFSPDGKTIASGSNDNTVRLWDVDTRAEIGVLEGHTFHWSYSNFGIQSVSFSPDGKTIASAAFATVHLWDVETQTEIGILEVSSTSILRVSFSPDGQTIAGMYPSAGFRVRFWDVAKQTTLTFAYNFFEHYVFNQTIWEVLWVVAALDDARLINIYTIFWEHTGAVESVSFSPDGKRIAASVNHYITKTYRSDYTRMWDVATLTEIDTLTHLRGDRRYIGRKSSGNKSVSFSPDGKTIVSGCEQQYAICLRDAATYTEIRRLEIRGYLINIAVFSPDGHMLAILQHNNQGPYYSSPIVRLWDVTTDTEIGILQGHIGQVQSVSFSPDGRTLVTAGSIDGTVRMWDMDTLTEITILRGHTGWVNSVAFSPDGKTIVSGSNDHTVRLWNMDTQTEIAILEGHTDAVNSVTFNPDGKTIVSGSDDTTVRLWDFATRTGRGILTGHDTYAVNSVSFSPGGKTIASGSDDGTVLLWNITSADHGNTLVEATSLLLGRYLTAKIDPGNDVDYFRVPIEVRGQLTLWTTTLGSLDTIGTLQDSEGITLATHTVENGDEALGFRIEHVVEPGTYYIKVQSSEQKIGDYTLYTAFVPATDVNVDGVVDVLDLVIVAENFGSLDTPLTGDVNGDGEVNREDINAVLDALEESAAAPAVSTTESLQRWIDHAKQLNLTDVRFQKGIAVLQNLLTILRETETVPKTTALLANYPNPFNPETWIPYQLAKPADVTLKIYAADGKLVRQLILGHQDAGMYHSRVRAAYWDGKNATGEPVASGLYFYTLTAGDFSATRKLLIRK